MKKLILALVLAAGTASAQKAETPKEKDIRKLLQLTGAAQLGGQVMNEMLQTFKKSAPNVPESFWTELSKELNPDELVEKVIPVYDKELSAGEIKDLIKFYETPTGKKLIKVMPAITQQSMVIGREWGRSIGEKVMDKLKAQQNKK